MVSDDVRHAECNLQHDQETKMVQLFGEGVIIVGHDFKSISDLPYWIAKEKKGKQKAKQLPCSLCSAPATQFCRRCSMYNFGKIKALWLPTIPPEVF